MRACKTLRGASVASTNSSIGATAGALDRCAARTDRVACAEALTQTSKQTHTTRKGLTRLIKGSPMRKTELELEVYGRYSTFTSRDFQSARGHDLIMLLLARHGAESQAT